MGASDWIDLVCPDCGALCRGGETACFLCGRKLEPARGLASGGIRTPAAHATPYEAASASFSPKRGLWIIAGLLAAIVVCLGVVNLNKGLGVFLALAFAPPLSVYARCRNQS